MMLSFTHSNTIIILISTLIQREDLRRKHLYMEKNVSQFLRHKKKKRKKGKREGGKKQEKKKITEINQKANFEGRASK